MDSTRIIAGEAVIAMSMSAWRDIKHGYVPLPWNIVGPAVAFGVIAVIETASPEFAVALASGFLLAKVIQYLQSNEVSKPPSLPAGYGDESFLHIGNPTSSAKAVG